MNLRRNGHLSFSEKAKLLRSFRATIDAVEVMRNNEEDKEILLQQILKEGNLN